MNARSGGTAFPLAPVTRLADVHLGVTRNAFDISCLPLPAALPARARAQRRSRATQPVGRIPQPPRQPPSPALTDPSGGRGAGRAPLGDAAPRSPWGMWLSCECRARIRDTQLAAAVRRVMGVPDRRGPGAKPLGAPARVLARRIGDANPAAAHPAVVSLLVAWMCIQKDDKGHGFLLLSKC